MGKVIGSSLFSLLLLLGLVLPMQTTVPVLQPMTVAANDLTGHLPATGEVKGDGVFGYTTNYVCYGGAIEEQHAVQNGWHITLKNAHYSHGVQWFECWDTDDGDYYMDGLTGNILPFIPAPSKMSPPPAVLQLRLRVFPLEKDKLPEMVSMVMPLVMPAIQTGHRQHSTK